MILTSYLIAWAFVCEKENRSASTGTFRIWKGDSLWSSNPTCFRTNSSRGNAHVLHSARPKLPFNLDSRHLRCWVKWPEIKIIYKNVLMSYKRKPKVEWGGKQKLAIFTPTEMSLSRQQRQLAHRTNYQWAFGDGLRLGPSWSPYIKTAAYLPRWTTSGWWCGLQRQTILFAWTANMDCFKPPFP